MLNLLIVVLAAACAAVYIIAGHMLASAKEYSPELTTAEKERPLAVWHSRDCALDEQTMASLRPFGAERAITFSAAAGLAGADSPEGNGFHVFTDKSGYARIQTVLPGLSQEMIDWWYAWVGFEPIRFKIWFPDRHAQAAYGEKPTDETCSLRALYGRRLQTVERIGRNAPLQKLEYRIVNPADWGLPTDQSDYWICQEVKNGPWRLGKIILRLAPHADGLAATAHIWLGKDLPVLLRRFLAGGQNLYDWSSHICQELERLPVLLPRLHADHHHV